MEYGKDYKEESASPAQPGDAEKNIPERSAAAYLKIAIWKSLPWLVVIIVLVGLLFGLYAAIVSKQKEIDEEKALAEKKITAETVNVKDWVIAPSKLVDDISLPGIVQPWEQLTLESEVTGRVLKFTVDEGDHIKKGEVVALIDERDYRASVKRLEAALTLAEQSLRRISGLKKQGAVPQSDLDAAQADFDTAQANLDATRLNLERCRITAPFSGVVNKRYITDGTLVTPGSEIIELLDINKVKVGIGIPEADVDMVRNLNQATITVDALAGRKFIGKKTFLSLKPEDAASVYELRLAIDNSESLLRPGMFVEAVIVRQVKENALVVPLFSVVTRGENSFCYVVENSKAVRKAVTLGISKGRMIEIPSGIEKGEHLIVIGQRQVDDQQDVRVIETVTDLQNLLK